MALARYEENHNLAILTQNIDGLHTLAGSHRVYELHGSVQRYRCMKCGKAFALSDLNPEGVPICDSCGGIIKPDVVLYEEPLNDGIMTSAIQYIRNADILIIGGTSLNVYPAAGLINYYNGDKLVLVNLSETPYDRYANLVIHEKIGEVFGQI